MGVGVSNWVLARAVAERGQLGVVSGTALSLVLARRLQLGDPDGNVRRAMAAFPLQAIAQRVLDRYFVPGGKPANKPFIATPIPDLAGNAALIELTVLGNFCEVWLAREGHHGQVGINYLEKIQIPTLPSVYGAMLAGVDYVLMGAGIPRLIPGALDRFATGAAAQISIDVDMTPEAPTNLPAPSVSFDPNAFMAGAAPVLKRPAFLAIVSSATLAMTLARKSNGRVDGFIVEGACAGGHNAPPRGPMQLNDQGEPCYGPRDDVDLEKLRAIGLPFWLAGGYGAPGGLAAALAQGAAGIQVGTAFAFCEQSGTAPELKQRVLAMARDGNIRVRTDPTASPTSFPFKVVAVEGTLSEEEVVQRRRRVCDLGQLRRPFRAADGSIQYRCGAEPVDLYVRKGGNVEDTVGRKCICNALMATIGLGQVTANGVEPGIMTAGSTPIDFAVYCQPGKQTYDAADVLRVLLG